MNWTFDEMLDIILNLQKRKMIFSKLSVFEKYFPVWVISILTKKFGPRYSSIRKHKALKEIFQELADIQLPDVPEWIGKPSLQLVVSTFDYEYNKAKFFRSNIKSSTSATGSETGTRTTGITLVDAVHGSSNVPINYFDFPAVLEPGQGERDYFLWDGALGGFNNTVATGVIEAISNLNDKQIPIHVLSLGTGNKVQIDDKKEETERIQHDGQCNWNLLYKGIKILYG